MSVRALLIWVYSKPNVGIINLAGLILKPQNKSELSIFYEQHNAIV